MAEFKSSQRLESIKPKFLVQQNKKISKMKANGISVINLGRGNPDQPTFPKIVGAVQQAVLDPINHGYPPYGGKQAFKEAIRAFYKDEYGVELDVATEIAVFNGSTVALTALSLALLNPGDVCLVPDPSFTAYEIGASMAGAKIFTVPLLEKNDFLPDYSSLPSSIRDQAKLLFLNYPHNPTGAVANRSFFDQTVAFAKDSHLAVCHDFAYGDISFGEKAPSFLQSKGAKDVGIEIYTMSKTFNMAGWRVGFAVGNPSIIAHLNKYLQNSVGSVFGAIQDASIVALKTQQIERHELTSLYKRRQRFMIRALRDLGWEVYPSGGTFFLWIKAPEGVSSVEFSSFLLENFHVGVVPGLVYGRYGEGYIRVSLVADEKVLSEGIERLKLWENKWKEKNTSL